MAAIPGKCDVLTLKSGLIFDVEVVKVKKRAVIAISDGEKLYIPAGDIESIVITSPASPVLKSGEFSDLMAAGANDAKNFHGKTVGHFFLGVFFGPIAMAGTAIASPTPYKGKMTPYASDNKDLFADPEYLSGYRKTAKRRLLISEAAGTVLFVAALFLPIY